MNLEKILAAIKPIDKDIIEKAKNRSNELIIPFRAMGDLHELAEQLCGITQSVKPKVKRKAIFLMVADHGVVEENISAYPQSITLEMVKAFVEGVATISVLSKTFKSKLIVADVGMKKNYSKKVIKNKHTTFLCEKVGHSTKNFKTSKAMTYNEAIRSIETGFNVANKYIKHHDLHLVATGDMGVGNTTAASAIASVFCDEPPENITGMGSHIDNDTLSRKIEVIKAAIAMHQPDKTNGIDVLSKVGGFEIGAIAGVILAGAYNRIPVVLDGAVTTSAALIAYSLKRYAKEYMIPSHLSADKSHQFMLDYLQLKPLLNLHMRLGEGSGAVLAFPIIKAAANILKKVATFKDLGIEK